MTDFFNLDVFADAVAHRLKGSLEQASPLKRLFSTEEAATYCGMPVASFKAKVVRDQLRKVRLDRCWRFDRADLDAWIDAHKEEIREHAA
jgi:predicted DNA-binding transcriptional regulator AlpA